MPFNYEKQFINEILSIFIIFITLIILLFIIGMWLSSSYIKYYDTDDPKEIIIDEVVGQMLVIILTIPNIIIAQNSWLKHYLSKFQLNFVFLFLLPFIVFRLCDILKPWPIGWVDKTFKSGFGVMFDDIAAGLMSIVIIYALTINLVKL